jgi:pimeloyl-ACP methyl ester carboxylesterase
MISNQVLFIIFCLLAATQINFTLAISATGQSLPVQEHPQRPQTPKPKYPYKQREVTFTNPKDGTKLVGTLAMPFGRGKYAAVILLPGSGAQDRDQTFAEHKPALVISDYLVRQGLAVLRFDSRGIGKSSGNYFQSTGDDFAADVIAGINFLKQQSEINSNKIGLIGHSLGGGVASIAASSSPDVKFIILLASPGLTDLENGLIRTAITLKSKGVNEAETQKTLAAFKQMQVQIGAGADDATLRPLMQNLIHAIYPEFSNEETNAIVEQQLQTVRSPFAKFFTAYNPQATLRKVRCPVLALNGTSDRVMSAKENLEAIQRVLREARNPDVTVQELPELNHYFQTAKTGDPMEVTQLEETISPTVLRLVASWIQVRTKTKL